MPKAKTSLYIAYGSNLNLGQMKHRCPTAKVVGTAELDSVVDELAKDERVSTCYDAWYEMRNQVLQTYADKLPDPLPLSQQKEFKAIKNIVISEAMRLGSFDIQIALNDAPVIADTVLPDSDPEFFVEPDGVPDYQEEGMPDDDSEYRVEWSDEYKLARDFLFGTKTIAPDFDEAHALLLMEAESGNALAMHDLGRMHADGLGRNADAEAAYDWYAKALAGFLAVETAMHKPYIQYRIGKMYAAGFGTEQDYTQAAKWFSSAAEKNHKYAQYSLGGLYYRGQGVAQDYEKAFDLYEKSSAQENAYASYELAKMLRDGIGCERNQEQTGQYFKIAFEGFQSMEAERSDDRLQYRLGQMLRDGVGQSLSGSTEPDAEQARMYFEASAKLGNPHAQYALAKMIIEAVDAGAKPADTGGCALSRQRRGRDRSRQTAHRHITAGRLRKRVLPAARIQGLERSTPESVPGRARAGNCYEHVTKERESVMDSRSSTLHNPNTHKQKRKF